MSILYSWGPFAAVNALSDITVASKFDGASHLMGATFVLPKSGTITKVGLYVGLTIVGTVPTSKVGMLTLNSTGNPDVASPYGGSVAADVDITTTGWTWFTLATPATAVRGNVVWAGLYPGSTPPDASNYCYIGYGGLYGFNGLSLHMLTTRNSVSGLCAALQYSDDSIVGIPISTSTTEPYPLRADNSPDELGAKFTVEHAMTIVGFGISKDMGFAIYTAPPTYTLYDAADNVLRQTVFPANYSEFDFEALDGYFAPITLAPDTTYRITAKTNSTVYVFQPRVLQLPSAGHRSLLPSGDRWQLTYRTDAGAWTDVDTIIPAMWLRLTNFFVNVEYAYG